MSVLHRVRRLAQAVGLDVTRFPEGTAAWRRARLLAHHDVSVVFDVGANDGRYVQELRRFGYEGWAVSFEPAPSAFLELQRNSAKDDRWRAEPFAIGASESTVTLNVAGNAGASSSVLPMLPAHLNAAPSSAYVGRHDATQRRLDDIWRDFAGPDEVVFLKLDVQGYEGEVLRGASQFLESCVGLQVEVSFLPLYEGAPPYDAILSEVTDRGFKVMSVDPGFTDATTGQVLQADFVLFR